MEWIAHRINQSHELSSLPREYGVEMDLRDSGGQLLVTHDPYGTGETFDQWLLNYQQTGPLILNVKSERIEWDILRKIHDRGIENYFFLDSSFPMIMALSDKGETRIALRFSEMEGLDTIRNMRGRCEWIWVDCFTRMPLTREIFTELKSLDYKICMVSPDLQGRKEDIALHARQLRELNIKPDAICVKTQNRHLWE